MDMEKGCCQQRAQPVQGPWHGSGLVPLRNSGESSVAGKGDDREEGKEGKMSAERHDQADGGRPGTEERRGSRAELGQG